MLDSLHEFINTHYADQLNVEYLSRMSGVSASYLNRLFKRKFGMGVQEVIIAARMTAAKEMLLTGNFMIKQVAAKCGYDDPLYFSKAFRKYYGYSPSAI
jgi:AraC-like DNA-binding protein